MKKIYILDASGYIYRSYHAIHMMTNAKGESTNALFGFARSLIKLIKDFHPFHLVSVFDGPNNARKRTEMYPEYKSNRKAMPEDLLYQIHRAQEYCRLMGIPELMIPGVEADDTMGAVARWAADLGAEAFVCTGDKDMCQIVTDKIFILNTYKDNLILGPDQVTKQFGIPPELVIDFLAITGDASDNVPGLPGFGPKTAAELLKKFGSLDYLLDHPLEVSGKKKQETLTEFREQALLSRRLVTLDQVLIIPHDIDFYRLRQVDTEPLKEFYASMGFHSLIKEIETQKQSKSDTEKHHTNDKVSYILVDDESGLDRLIELLSKQKEICIDTETTSLSILEARLVGIGLGTEAKKAWYIPTNGKLGLELVLNKLKPLLTDPNISFYGHNIKYDYHIFLNHDIQLATIGFDTILASYLLNSHTRRHSLDHLCLEIFGKVKIPIEELIGKGKKQRSMNDVPVEQVCEYCCEDVDYTVRLKELLSLRLEERKLTRLFEGIELPLIPILAGMERQGIFVDLKILHNLSKEIGAQIHLLETEIYGLAGETFNINSPKQLGVILFEKLGIKPPKKTATGNSTNADVLESLAPEYPIARKLSEYRTVEKLRSTYIESLPLQVNERTHRIHCTFNQSMTATGRLSCSDPNLQNIPVRTPLGLAIREAFRPQKPGWSYLAADYSQIELRLLAHLSEDPALIAAFNGNEDIHTFTASRMFNIPLEEVTKEQRSRAKSVNFGIIYGQQAFGLAQELGIDRETAAAFIRMYFDRYPKVKTFLDGCKQSSRETGKTVTIFGRERLIPEINSGNGIIRSAAERLAVNAPIQGSQADIIKMAMIEIDKKLAKEQKKGYMILQIHDELIFEIPDEELESMRMTVRETMEGIIKLKVPLVVDIHVGKNWKEC
jgi:DNA polymerase-1